jgi:hypothetical protein
MLRNLLGEYLAFYNTERNHQGLGNLIPFPKPERQNYQTNASWIAELLLPRTAFISLESKENRGLNLLTVRGLFVALPSE